MSPSPAAETLHPFEPLPWMQPHWRRLWDAYRHDRLGHAQMLIGPAGIGKRHFADLFAAALMCQKPEADGQPCRGCRDCVLFAAGNHPDMLRIEPDPESNSAEIKVDAVRELCSRQSLTTNRGPRAVLRIAPADALNTHAANGLLKTLEEPADSSLLFLITEDPGRLPATVLSRCQRVTMSPPDVGSATGWLSSRLGDCGFDNGLLLRLAHDAPLRALAMADAQRMKLRKDCFCQFRSIAEGRADPIAVASAWQQLDAALLLGWMAGWISDLLRIDRDVSAVYLDNPDWRDELAGLASRLVPKLMHRFLQQVLLARASGSSPINKLLLFESLLVRWSRLAAANRRSSVTWQQQVPVDS